ELSIFSLPSADSKGCQCFVSGRMSVTTASAKYGLRRELGCFGSRRPGHSMSCLSLHRASLGKFALSGDGTKTQRFALKPKCCVSGNKARLECCQRETRDAQHGSATGRSLRRPRSEASNILCAEMFRWAQRRDHGTQDLPPNLLNGCLACVGA